MNVALVHRRFTEHGGTERFLVGLAQRLLSDGHEVHIYCNSLRADLRDTPGLRLHHLPMLRWTMAGRLLSLWLSSGRAVRGGHDVVMGFGRTRGHAVFRAGGGAHAAYLEACRPLWWLDPVAWLERALDARAARSARRVISPSAMAARDLSHHYGVPIERITVIPNGVDSARFTPDPQRRAAVRDAWGVGEGAVVAFLGTGFRRKGLAEAVAVSRRLGATLVVMGRDRAMPLWRRRFPDVRFLGAVRAPEHLLPAADVLLLPTRYEPYGNACLEAMACGVVPVTTPRNGVAEVFPVEGLVGEGVEALTAACQRALDGGQALRDACRQRAVALTREAAYAAVEDILRAESL